MNTLTKLTGKTMIGALTGVLVIGLSSKGLLMMNAPNDVELGAGLVLVIGSIALGIAVFKFLVRGK